MRDCGGAMLKSHVGVPTIQFAARRIDLAAEARRARRRFYPATLLYSAYALAVLVLAIHSVKAFAFPLASFGGGVAAWTLIEYLAHRYVLHRPFPDGPGAIRHRMHVAFDSLHAEHHARPWDGGHISGRIRDTGPYMAIFAGLSFLAPVHTVPLFWAGVMQAYVVEEWLHQTVHYLPLYGFRGRYWSYISRHHTYHHSPRGADLAFGLTSGIWDVVFRTRIPERDRDRLYRCRRRRSASAAPPCRGRASSPRADAVGLKCSLRRLPGGK